MSQSANLKFENSCNASDFIDLVRKQKSHWLVSEPANQAHPYNHSHNIAESIQRQSGLFQLIIPESGVLPVTHAALAKISAFLTESRYSVTAQVPGSGAGNLSLPPPNPSPLGIINRRYEDMFIEEGGSIREVLITDQATAKESILKFTPLLGKIKRTFIALT